MEAQPNSLDNQSDMTAKTWSDYGSQSKQSDATHPICHGQAQIKLCMVSQELLRDSISQNRLVIVGLSRTRPHNLIPMFAVLGRDYIPESLGRLLQSSIEFGLWIMIRGVTISIEAILTPLDRS